MKSNSRNFNLFFIIIPLLVLFLVTIACQLNVGGPEMPAATIPVSEESAQQAENIIQDAVSNSVTTSNLVFTLTEEQITSYVALRFKEQYSDYASDPQIYLQNNSIDIYGKVEQNAILATVHVGLTPGVDSSGNLTLEISTVDFGPFPVPSGFLDELANLIDKAINDLIYYEGKQIKINSIYAANGMITIEGQVQ